MTAKTFLGIPQWARVLPAMILAATAQAATAQPYPSGLIRIFVGGGAGAPPDIISRIVANELGQSEGWRIVIENKPGAVTTLAAGEVLKQPADGHAVLALTLGSSAAPALLTNIAFRYDTDFVPVIKLMTAHHVLVANPSVPAKSIAELVALLKGPTGQAFLLIGRVRNAGPSDRRAIPAQNGSARHSRPLPDPAASDRRPYQWHQITINSSRRCLFSN